MKAPWPLWMKVVFALLVLEAILIACQWYRILSP